MKKIHLTRRTIKQCLFLLLLAGLIFANPHAVSAQNKNTNSAAGGNVNAANSNVKVNTPGAPANNGTATPGEQAAKQTTTDTKTDDATKQDGTQQADKPVTEAELKTVSVTGVSGRLALFNPLTVTVKNLPVLLKAANNDYSKIILYLNGYPFKGITPRAGKTSEELLFDLKRTDENKKSWDSLLGRPTLPIPKMKDVNVTVGLDGQAPLMPAFPYKMTVINPIGYWIYVAALLVLTWLFLRWASNTEVLRVGPNLPDGSLQRYSLGRVQMAYWFFLVAASYVFIWMVTSEYGVLPGSVLGLIGISAATALGAVAINASGPGSVAASVTPQPTSGHFFQDIFSDEQGKLTFHRFQIVVWSVVLGIIFIASIYNILAMPDFPNELLALMGISAGTYLGFKFPEKQEAQNRATAAASGINPPALPTQQPQQIPPPPPPQQQIPPPPKKDGQ